MKLSSETLGVLANFAKFNPGIEFKQGNVLRTMSTGKTVLAKVKLKEEFPHDFCVYDLPKFLLTYNIIKDSEIEFDDVNIIFKSGSNNRNQTKIRKSQKDVILVPPPKDLSLPSVDVSFTLTQEDFASALNFASALQSPHITLESDGDKIYIVACDAENDSADTNSIELSGGNGKKFKSVFLTENLRLIPGSYDIQISEKGLASFTNNNQEIQYWVAVEAKLSKFGE